tara:strand:- start:369 stop:638 length:270 start_codon:yes stop_codon:yes gene_type:complete
MLQNTNTITINDNPITINQKLARIEANAIIENFLKDFGFDLLALPSLDLPLKEYCRELELQAWLEEIENGDDCLQCIDNSVNHHCPCQY